MKIYLSKQFISKYKKLTKKNPHLIRITENKLSLFKQNPKHPSLRQHILKGKLKKYWSISIEPNIRIVFVYIDKNILLFDIGKHEEVY